MDGGRITEHRRLLLQADITIWLSTLDDAFMREEATGLFPYETGGAFMGYWANQREVVITASISAGPNAKHGRFTFEPDYEWQQAAIAEHYTASGRRETYLGDWHTHPAGISGRLSWADKRVLKRIAVAKAARAPQPIMIIYYGGPEEWHFESWSSCIQTRKLLWPRLVTTSAKLEFFEK